MAASSSTFSRPLRVTAREAKSSAMLFSSNSGHRYFAASDVMVSKEYFVEYQRNLYRRRTTASLPCSVLPRLGFEIS